MKYYVDANAHKDGNGSLKGRSRGSAKQQKRRFPAMKCWLRRIYREYVDPLHSGTEDARITYVSTTPLGAAVITSAERVKTWKHYKEMSGFAISRTALSEITTHIRPGIRRLVFCYAGTSIPAAFT